MSGPNMTFTVHPRPASDNPKLIVDTFFGNLAFLVRWNRNGLAKRSAVSASVVHRAEAVDGEPHTTMAQEIAIKSALVLAGVEFTVDPSGARLRTVDPR